MSNEARVCPSGYRQGRPCYCVGPCKLEFGRQPSEGEFCDKGCLPQPGWLSKVLFWINPGVCK